MRCLLIPALTLIATGTLAEPVQDVVRVANEAFAQMPDVAPVDGLGDQCGATSVVNMGVAYCTSRNLIFLDRARAQDRGMPYLLAHVYAHAIHVQHGVADVALRTIRARPAEENALRQQIEAQADCIAGFILARSGLALPDIASAYDRDPLSGVHWGRNPLRIGPQVSVSPDVRDVWVAKGHRAQDLSACATKDFSATLLIQAYRGQ